MKLPAALLALSCAAGFAQTTPADSEKPPAEVERAVRSRVNEFYTLLLNREYRKAEAFVAEDTKDFYYDGAKPQFTKFELLDIKFFDHFTRAIATTQCTQKVIMPGFPAGEWSLRIGSTWKLENGNWYWYLDRSAILNPVGLATKVDAEKAAAGAAAGNDATPAAAGIPKEIPVTADFALGKVTADKPAVTLARGATEKITITNGSMGQVRLITSVLSGIDVKLDRVQLNAHEKAIVTLEAGKAAAGGVLYVQVMPTAEAIAIAVTIK